MKTDKKHQSKEKEGNNISNDNLWKLRNACMTNAIDLCKEANILYENKCYSRAFMLAYTSMEEVGKYIIVCDYITGVCAKDEFEEAFRNHDIKTAYVHSNLKIDTKSNIFNQKEATLVYDKSKYKHFFIARNNSAYVGCDLDYTPIIPSSEITEQNAKEIIQFVKREIDFIIYAEDLNCRIGSKALYK